MKILHYQLLNIFKNIKQKKSHYSRADTGRYYLQPGLSIKLMYNHWKNEMINNNKKTALYSKYYFIFTNKFNLGFGHPRQDICSSCVEQENQIQNSKDETILGNLKENLSNHKQTSKKFHILMKETNDKSLNISFDMMQNQPLPKVSITEAFYSRQVWLYNLTFVINCEKQNPESCFLYTWLETES